MQCGSWLNSLREVCFCLWYWNSKFAGRQLEREDGWEVGEAEETGPCEEEAESARRAGPQRGLSPTFKAPSPERGRAAEAAGSPWALEESTPA